MIPVTEKRTLTPFPFEKVVLWTVAIGTAFTPFGLSRIPSPTADQGVAVMQKPDGELDLIRYKDKKVKVVEGFDKVGIDGVYNPVRNEHGVQFVDLETSPIEDRAFKEITFYKGANLLVLADRKTAKLTCENTAALKDAGVDCNEFAELVHQRVNGRASIDRLKLIGDRTVIPERPEVKTY